MSPHERRMRFCITKKRKVSFDRNYFLRGRGSPRFWFRKQPSHSAVASGSSIPSDYSTLQEVSRFPNRMPRNPLNRTWPLPPVPPHRSTGLNVVFRSPPPPPPPPSFLSFFISTRISKPVNFTTIDTIQIQPGISSRSLFSSKFYFTRIVQHFLTICVFPIGTRQEKLLRMICLCRFQGVVRRFFFIKFSVLTVNEVYLAAIISRLSRKFIGREGFTPRYVHCGIDFKE